MHDGRRGKLVNTAAGFEFSVARRQHVFHPFRLAAIGECNEKAAVLAKNIYGRAINLSGLASHMSQNSEAGKPAGKQTCDTVREKYVELRHPAFAEAHQQDSRDGDGNEQEKAHVLKSLLHVKKREWGSTMEARCTPRQERWHGGSCTQAVVTWEGWSAGPLAQLVRAADS